MLRAVPETQIFIWRKVLTIRFAVGITWRGVDFLMNDAFLLLAYAVPALPIWTGYSLWRQRRHRGSFTRHCIDLGGGILLSDLALPKGAS
jgi:hypothetical protein